LLGRKITNQDFFKKWNKIGKWETFKQISFCYLTEISVIVPCRANQRFDFF